MTQNYRGTYDNKEIHTGERKKKIGILVSNKNSNKVKNNTKWIVICKKKFTYLKHKILGDKISRQNAISLTLK